MPKRGGCIISQRQLLTPLLLIRLFLVPHTINNRNTQKYGIIQQLWPFVSRLNTNKTNVVYIMRLNPVIKIISPLLPNQGKPVCLMIPFLRGGTTSESEQSNSHSSPTISVNTVQDIEMKRWTQNIVMNLFFLTFWIKPTNADYLKSKIKTHNRALSEAVPP